MKKHWLGDPIADKIMGVVVELAKELYVTQDRLEVLERLLDENALVPRNSIELYFPSAESDEELRKSRDRFISAILRPIVDDARDT